MSHRRQSGLAQPAQRMRRTGHLTLSKSGTVVAQAGKTMLLILDLKTLRVIGVTVPQSVLLRATEVIE